MSDFAFSSTHRDAETVRLYTLLAELCSARVSDTVCVSDGALDVSDPFAWVRDLVSVTHRVET